MSDFTTTELVGLRRLVEARLHSLVWEKDRAPWETLLGKLKHLIGFVSAEKLVFRIELPLVRLIPRKRNPSKPPWKICLCPTLNEYDRMQPWQQKKARAIVDALIEETKATFPSWMWGGREEITTARVPTKDPDQPFRDVMRRKRHGGVRRGVYVVRHSSRRIDELSVDVAGGKIPIDRLVNAKVLGGDSAVWLARKAAWTYAPPGAAKLVVEVYDLAGPDAIPGAR